MNRFPRLMISAAHKSSGKTVISTGIAAALRADGVDLRTFKKGPDYIDPMWLALASGQPCYNLDFNTMDAATLCGFFTSRAAARDLSLVEANKGLFDGVAADGSDSNAELAKLLGLPVVLVIDTMGMTRGIAPLLQGYVGFDRGVDIQGIILNRTGGPRHEAKLRTAVETYSDIEVLGAVGRNPALEIGERHLGLITPAERGGLERLVAGFEAAVRDGIDLGALRAIAAEAPPLDAPPLVLPPANGAGLRIGIARDAAFGFYYADDLEALAAAGATMVPIDMIADGTLPDIDGLFIGGGFPETQAAALAANTALRTALKTALGAGLPAYAECGGLMYLCRSLSYRGQAQPMVGLIEADAVMHDRPRGRGYVRFTDTAAHPWGAPGEQRAHEFHYASIENLAPGGRFARSMARGTGIGNGQDALVIGNTVAGFCHLRSTGACGWVPRFLDFVRAKKNPAR